MKKNITKITWIFILLSGIIAIIAGLIWKPFYLTFINTLTITACVGLLIGVIQWGIIQGDFDVFTWRRNKGSYREYKELKKEDRKDATNPILISGLILAVISIILSLLY